MNEKRTKTLQAVFLLGLFFYIPIISPAQNVIVDLENFPPSSYAIKGKNPGPQNWNIIQDKQGIIYVSNTNGILSFDGNEWRMINGTSQLSQASIIQTPSGLIFAANKNEIGYFLPDSIGSLNFISLKERLPMAIKEEPDIHWMRILGNQLYFISRNHVLFWDESTKQFHIWSSQYEIMEAFVWNQKLLLWLKNGGIFQLKPTGLEPYMLIQSNEFSLVKSVIPAAGSHEENMQFLVFTQEKGMYEIRSNQLQKSRNELNSLFPDIVIWDAIKLSSGYIAIATNSEGILIIDQQGNLISQINKDLGLAVNGVIALYEDQTHALWAALDVGVARISQPGNLHFWGSDHGLEGTVMSVWSDSREIWVGTTAGLFRTTVKNSWNENYAFEKQSITQLEVWSIISFQDRLLFATSEGVFAYNGKAFSRISRNNIALTLQPSQTDPNLVYVGLYEGMATLRLIDPQTWVWSYIPGISHQVRSISEFGGYVWAANRKLSRIDFNTSPPEILLLESGKGFPEGAQLLDLFKYREKLYVGSWAGILQFDPVENKLVEDTLLGREYSRKSKPAFPVTVDTSGKIWFSSSNKPMVYIPSNDLIQRIDSNSLGPIDKTVWSITESNQKIWLGTSDGVYRYDSKNSQPVQQNFKALISRVILNEDSIIFGGYDLGMYSIPEVNQQKKSLQVFPYEIKEISFLFTSNNYSFRKKNIYRYKLEGFDSKWSDWKSISQKSYTGLRDGTYTFRIEAKDIFGHVSSASAYTFSISPPWFRRTWAYGLYLLGLSGVVFMLISYQSYRHKKKLELKERELEREREAAAKLRQIDKLKDAFLANTSHELRTPLNGIIGIAESLVDGVAGPVSDNLRSNLDMIIGSGKRLSSLVDDIMDFSKLKNRELILHRKPVDLHALTQVVLRNCEPLIQGKDIQIRNEIPANLKAVYGDEGRILQILFNLIGNAIKFTEKGFITLMAVLQKDQILISVSDTGIGIPVSMQQKIFESFEQGDGSSTRTYGGTGLGLTITRQLIELHGGSISVKSTPGKGSTFYFILPTTEQRTPSPEISNGSSPKLDQTHTRPLVDTSQVQETIPVRKYIPGSARILVVDDDPVNQQVLKNHLTLNNYAVVTSFSGKEALYLLESQKSFDLVLLDIMMPQMSGYEVCEQIRKSYLPSELPVIMLTAKNQVSDLVQGLSVGANDYISKPFSKDEFLARIKTHLNLLQINRSTGRFLPTEFLHALGKDSVLDIQLGDQVEKEVTVMFVDIRSYTTLAENLSPRETFDFINDYLGRVGPIIRNNQGFVSQYYGDGIMALFLNSPMDALKTAHEMLLSIKKMNEIRKKENLMPIRIGIGIHKGPLMMGIIGDNQRMDASVVADTVNTASRMEGLTKYYGSNIILSANVKDALTPENDFQFRYLGDVQVKGRKNLVGLYECFSADQEEEIRGKALTLDYFQKAVTLYFNQSFEEAGELFKQILDQSPLDQTSALFLQKCRDHLFRGIPKNWSGVESLE